MFDITKFSLYNLLQAIIEAFHQDYNISGTSLAESIKNKGLERELNSLWELNMLTSQKPIFNDIKRQISRLITGVQIKQLEKEIREWKLKLDKQTFTDDDYQHYISLKNEYDALVKEYNFN